MKDLCELSGLPRQAIHFYIQEGLLPEGVKTGRNTAYYSDEHLARIKLIRQLQEERFLPLKAIRAILHDGDGDGNGNGFSAPQLALLREVKRGLPPSLTSTDDFVDAAPHLHALGLQTAELEAFGMLGLVAVERPKGKRRLLFRHSDLFVLETWAALKQLGFSPANGFRLGDMRLYTDALAAMFAEETALITANLGARAAPEVGQMLERALPLVNHFLGRYHEKLLRSLFSSL